MGCVRPCERKEKILRFFHFHHVKIHGDYQTKNRIFEDATRLLPYFVKKSSKNDYAKINDAKITYFIFM